MSNTITEVRIRGLKVDHLDVRLGRLNFLKGLCGVGKSAVPDGIQFAGLGCVPRVGATNLATAKMMRGDDAEVTVAFNFDDRAEYFTRSLTRDGVSCRQAATASWLPARTKTDEASEKIQLCFGKTEAEAAQNLDITRLTNAPAGELAATVEKLLDAAGMPAEQIDLEVRRIFSGRIATLRPNVDGIVGELPPLVVEFAPGIGNEMAERARRSIADAILWAKDRKNDAASSDRDLQAAAANGKKRLAELKAPLEASVDLRARRTAAHARAEEIDATLKIYRQGTAARAAAKTEAERARSAMTQASEMLAIRKEAAKKAHTLRAEIEALRTPAAPIAPALVFVDQEALAKEIQPHKYQLDQLLEQEPKHPAAPVLLTATETDIDAVCGAGTYAEWLAANAESKRRHATAREAGERPLPEIPSIEAEKRTLWEAERDLAAADQSPWTEVKNLADALDEEYGPDKNVAVDVAKNLRELVRTHGLDRTTFEGEVIRAKESLAQATLLREAAQEELAAAQENLRKLARDATGVSDYCARLHAEFTAKIEAENTKRRDSIAPAMAAYHAAREAYVDEQRRLGSLIELAKYDHAKKAEKANREAQTAHATAVRLFEAACTAVDAERNAKLAEVQRLERDERVAERILADAEKALAAADAGIAGAAESMTVDEAALDAERTTLTGRLDQLDEALKVVGSAEALRAELARTIDAAERKAAMRDIFTAAEWALTRVRDADLRTRAGALEEPMRRFMRPVVDAGEPMIRAEKGKVQLGLRFGERFVDAAALSGGQAALFRAALCFAQLVVRGPILRVLHIELAEACDGLLDQQILRACEAVADEVQVIVTTCVPIPEPDESRGWNIIRVEKEAAPAA